MNGSDIAKRLADAINTKSADQQLTQQAIISYAAAAYSNYQRFDTSVINLVHQINANLPDESKLQISGETTDRKVIYQDRFFSYQLSIFDKPCRPTEMPLNRGAGLRLLLGRSGYGNGYFFCLRAESISGEFYWSSYYYKPCSKPRHSEVVASVYSGDRCVSCNQVFRDCYSDMSELIQWFIQTLITESSFPPSGSIAPTFVPNYLMQNCRVDQGTGRGMDWTPSASGY